MLNPQFPYKSDQLILSSNRIILHSKQDAIFIFGKAAIGLSSTQTINLDAEEKILIDCQKIELGNKAESQGQPLVLGNELNRQLINLLEQLSIAGDQLKLANTTNLGLAMIAVHSAGEKISLACNSLKTLLQKTDNSGKPDSPILSKNTYTR